MMRFLPLLDVEQRVHKHSLPLDGLRGLLASSVLFHHAEIWFEFARTHVWSAPTSRLYAQIGPAAVTMFFFVSGFLFWGKVLRKPGQITWRQLLPNRGRRILPAYWAATLLIVVSSLLSSHLHLHEPPLVVVKESLQWIIGGFPELSSPNINGMDEHALSAGVFWTLRMEGLFYVLLPAIVWFRRRWRFPLLLLIPMVLLSAKHPIERLLGPHFAGVLQLLEQFLRMFAIGFLPGMAAAYRPWSDRAHRWMLSPVAAALATAIVVAGLSLAYRPYSIFLSLPLIPMFFLVVAGNTFGGLLSSRPMRALGQISYSIYILHGVLLFDCLTLWNRHRKISALSPDSYAVLVWGIGVVVVACATFSYWYIERPFTGGAAVARVHG